MELFGQSISEYHLGEVFVQKQHQVICATEKQQLFQHH